MSKEINIDKNLLIKKYIDENKSILAISKELGCGKTTIGRYLKMLGIQKRDRYELHFKIFNGKNNPFYGKKHSEYTKKLISITMIEQETTKGKNNPSFKYDISEEYLINEYIDCRKSTRNIAKQLGCDAKTILRKLKEFGISRRTCNETKKTIFKGPKNPNWNGGKSFEPYTSEFNKELKSIIRKRDNYICKNCCMTEEEHLIVYGCNLHAHHIDYNKENCTESNLVAVCVGCNARANFNRNYWINYYKNKLRVCNDSI